MCHAHHEVAIFADILQTKFKTEIQNISIVSPCSVTGGSAHIFNTELV